jgi:hypothetical protein
LLENQAQIKQLDEVWMNAFILFLWYIYITFTGSPKISSYIEGLRFGQRSKGRGS